MTSKLKENELIAEFDTLRKNFVQEEAELKARYLIRFNKVLGQIADVRKSKKVVSK